jgi:peptidoglycan hydrolase-like protein with peptidoglycan-binding domain
VKRLLALGAAAFLVLAAPASAATLGKRVVAKGDKGGDVVILQRVLSLKGYSVGAADGVFGRQTKVAVKAFQKRRGLQQDGRVGPATTMALASTWKVNRATLFGPGLYGNKTACGFVLTHHTRGIAHRTLPCGTQVAIYHDGLIALYPVIDRGPFADGVDLDVTAAAARQLRMTTTTDLRAGH